MRWSSASPANSSNPAVVAACRRTRPGARPLPVDHPLRRPHRNACGFSSTAVPFRSMAASIDVAFTGTTAWYATPSRNTFAVTASPSNPVVRRARHVGVERLQGARVHFATSGLGRALRWRPCRPCVRRRDGCRCNDHARARLQPGEVGRRDGGQQVEADEYVDPSRLVVTDGHSLTPRGRPSGSGRLVDRVRGRPVHLGRRGQHLADRDDAGPADARHAQRRSGGHDALGLQEGRCRRARRPGDGCGHHPWRASR